MVAARSDTSFAPVRRGPARRSLLVPGGMALAFLFARAADAQEPTLFGQITAADGRPLAGVQIQVAGLSVGALSGPTGRYELRAIPNGPHQLIIEHIGYRRLELTVDVSAGESARRDIALEVEPVALEDVEIVVPRSGRLAGFFDRRERGAGMFYTREEIGSMQARLVTDVLRRVPGAQLRPVSGPFGTSLELTFGRGAGSAGFRGCPVAYFVDGVSFQVAPDQGINSFVQVQDVAGIEVYSGSARIPSQFNPSTGNSRCGVVAIWTWDGREPAR
jgi:hypothetical protein